MRILVSFFAFIFLANAAFGISQCPPVVRYQNNRVLKHGDQYFYQSGRPLIRVPLGIPQRHENTQILFANGRPFKMGANYFYPNQRPLRRGNDLFYPNRKPLKLGPNYFYDNGNPMRFQGQLFHPNRQSARAPNGMLFRIGPVGTFFPIILKQPIARYGGVVAHVQSNDEDIYVRLHGQELLQDKHVFFRTIWYGNSQDRLQFFIRTGRFDDKVEVTIDETGKPHCFVTGQGPVPFTVSGTAAVMHVEVRPGYDAKRIRSLAQRFVAELDGAAPQESGSGSPGENEENNQPK